MVNTVLTALEIPLIFQYSHTLYFSVLFSFSIYLGCFRDFDAYCIGEIHSTCARSWRRSFMTTVSTGSRWDKTMQPVCWRCSSESCRTLCSRCSTCLPSPPHKVSTCKSRYKYHPTCLCWKTKKPLFFHSSVGTNEIVWLAAPRITMRGFTFYKYFL